jgi:hypothetical protein
MAAAPLALTRHAAVFAAVVVALGLAAGLRPPTPDASPPPTFMLADSRLAQTTSGGAPSSR